MDSATDTTLLQTIGTDILRSFISVVVETCFTVVYTGLVVKAMMILLLKARRGSHALRLTLLAVLVLYLLQLTLWVIDIRNIVVEVHLTLTARAGGSLTERYARTGDTVLRLALVEDVVYTYMTLIGDGIIFWRVYAFWHTGTEKLLLILPGLVYGSSVILCGLVTYCSTQIDPAVTFGALTNPPFCRNVQQTAYWTQLGIAAVATVLIAVKTWMHRDSIRNVMQGTADTEVSRSVVHRVMIVLVDTGVLYMLFFVSVVVLNFKSLTNDIDRKPSLAFAAQVYQYTTSSIVGIYPTVVVILVHAQFSSVDAEGNRTDLRKKREMSTMQFNTRPTGSSGLGPGQTVVFASSTADGIDVVIPELEVELGQEEEGSRGSVDIEQGKTEVA